jgi:acetylornithine deacetylase/succinyl-diaminopimelate desuccinylase-like protein
VSRYSPFERRRRRIARASLYGSLALVAGTAFLLWRLVTLPAAADRDMTWHEDRWEDDPAVRLLQQYVRIDTGPRGDELAGALFLSSALRSAGLAPEIVALGDRNANLRAVLPGERAEQLILLSHLDVEPASVSEDWEAPPFSGALVGPMIWGRGTFDMKSYAVAQLWALLDLAGVRSTPHHTVTFMATSEEEAGSHLGVRWLLWQRPEWFEAVWAVLTEGGLVEARTLSDPKYWAVETGQRTLVFFEVCATSRERLEAFQEDVRDLLPLLAAGSVDLTDPVREVWREYWPTRDRRELRMALADPTLLERDAIALDRLPAYLRSQVTNELHVNHAEPAPGGGWKSLAVLALLPERDAAPWIERSFPAWLTGGLTVTRLEAGEHGGASPLSHPAYVETVATLRRVEDIGAVGPFVLPWILTDARFLRSRGIPTYGFSPFLLLTMETLRAARTNEKIPAPAFVRGVELYRELVATLTR